MYVIKHVNDITNEEFLNYSLLESLREHRFLGSFQTLDTIDTDLTLDTRFLRLDRIQ